MARNYRVLLDIEVIGVIPKSGRRRKSVLSFIKGLSQFAHVGGGFEVSDPETQRIFQVTAVAGFAITWWADEAVNEVKVVDIRPTN